MNLLELLQITKSEVRVAWEQTKDHQTIFRGSSEEGLTEIDDIENYVVTKQYSEPGRKEENKNNTQIVLRVMKQK